MLYLGDSDDEGFQIPLTLIETISKWVIPPQYNLRDIYPKAGDKIYHKNSPVIFHRIALTPQQVELEGLPKDTVNQKFTIARKFVDFKAELEALNPDLLRALIRKAVEECFDKGIDKERKAKEDELREEVAEKVAELTKNWQGALKK